MVPSNGVMITVFTRGDHKNTLLLSYSRRKLNYLESSEFTSCDVFAEVFSNDVACIGP